MMCLLLAEPHAKSDCFSFCASDFIALEEPFNAADGQPRRFDEQPKQIADCRADDFSFCGPELVAFKESHWCELRCAFCSSLLVPVTTHVFCVRMICLLSSQSPTRDLSAPPSASPTKNPSESPTRNPTEVSAS